MAELIRVKVGLLDRLLIQPVSEMSITEKTQAFQLLDLLKKDLIDPKLEQLKEHLSKEVSDSGFSDDSGHRHLQVDGATLTNQHRGGKMSFDSKKAKKVLEEIGLLSEGSVITFSLKQGVDWPVIRKAHRLVIGTYLDVTMTPTEDRVMALFGGGRLTKEQAISCSSKTKETSAFIVSRAPWVSGAWRKIVEGMNHGTTQIDQSSGGVTPERAELPEGLLPEE